MIVPIPVSLLDMNAIYYLTDNFHIQRGPKKIDYNKVGIKKFKCQEDSFCLCIKETIFMMMII